MTQTKNTNVASRINIPVSQETRELLEQIAVREGITLAELGRRAMNGLIAENRRQQRIEELCETVREYSALLDKTAEEWRGTELDGWTND